MLKMKTATTFIIGLSAGILIGHSLKPKKKRTEPLKKSNETLFT